MFRERIAKKNVQLRATFNPHHVLTPLNSRQILWLTIVGLGAALLAAGALLPPFVGDEWRGLIMAGYRKVCHQLPDRSFHIAGHQIALCHRCIGIWGALPVAIALFSVLRMWDGVLAKRPGLTIVASLVPLGIDWSGDFFGLWANTVASRLLTGAIFGVVAGYFLARVVISSVRGPRDETNSRASSNTPQEP